MTAPGFDGRHVGGGAFEDRFDPPVGQVADKARDPAGVGLGPAALAEPDALDPARDPEMPPHTLGGRVRAQTWQASQ